VAILLIARSAYIRAGHFNGGTYGGHGFADFFTAAAWICDPAENFAFFGAQQTTNGWRRHLAGDEFGSSVGQTATADSGKLVTMMLAQALGGSAVADTMPATVNVRAFQAFANAGRDAGG
jgi:hypothetical protein